MKNHVRNYVTSALLMLPASFVMVALPTSALAQPAAPEVDTLDIEADAGLAPGSRLRVQLVATPRLKASLRIRGLRQTLPLRETSPGVYVGRYTLKNTDRVTGDSPVRALLTRGNRTTGFEYVLSDTLDAPAAAAQPVPAPPAPVAVPQLRIERFGMAPIERIEPGAELNFVVEGLPGATVSIDLPGVERDLRLRETRPGHYEGGYTIRRADDLNPNRPIVATMRSGDRVVTANLNMQVRQGADNRPSGDNRPPTLTQLVPSDGATVPAGQTVHVAAPFDDAGGSGVDPASVQLIVSGRNVTREAQISAQSLSFWTPLPVGRHSVDVTARDQAGNVMRKSWAFNVAAAAVAVPANVPIQILSHNNNGQVGQGATTVQGRTGPNASVAVTVQASAPLGGIVNIQQTLFQQTLQADGNGNFSFTFSPQFTLPGTRYEILMVSTRANVSHETRMTLIQR